MKRTLAELIDAYRANYPQEVRDLAETFGKATTRLGGDAGSAATPEEIRLIAQQHGLDVDVLSKAVADYSSIEQEAEAMYKVRKGKSG